jgi:hypothetical protein
VQWWRRAYRSYAYGQPLIVVSGLPRSGTSMMMRMLEAGGVPVWRDAARPADHQNPHGYFELERVKTLAEDHDRRWLSQGRGRAVKIVSSLLEHLPRTNNYKVIFMERDLDEVLASQAKMLAHRGQRHEGNDDALGRQYDLHLRKVKHLLSHDAAFSTLVVSYLSALNDPTATAERVRQFVERRLDVERMAAAVDPRLYRNRSSRT